MFQRKTCRCAALLLAISALSVPAANAAIIRWSFEGAITDIIDNSAVVADGLGAGDRFAATFEFSDAPIVGSDSHYSRYTIVSASVTLGSQVISLFDSSMPPGGPMPPSHSGMVEILDNVTHPGSHYEDRVTLSSSSTVSLMDSRSLSVSMSSNTQFQPSTVLGSVVPGATPPIPEVFQSNLMEFTVNSTDFGSARIQAVAPVPLPASAWLFAGGLCALLRKNRRRRGTSG